MKTIKNLTADELRKSILQLAIQGKLVKQNPDDEPASELVKRIYEEKNKLIAEGKIKKDKNQSYIFKGDDNCYYEKIGNNEPVKLEDLPFDIPNNWMWIRINNYVQKVTDFVASGSFASLRENVKYYKDKNYALMVKTQDFQNNFSKDLTYTDKHGYEFLQNSNLFGGELVLANVGSIGKVFRVPALNIPMTLAPNSIMVRFFDDKHLLWFMNMFQSPFGLELLLSISSATAIKKFNKTDFKSLLIPLPPLEEQQRIVDKINSFEPLLEKYDKVEKELSKLEKEFPEKLKKSILQYAIEGKLVKQDPNDEPASVLLERIKKEKERLIKEGKIKRDKNESYIYQGDDKNYYEKVGNQSHLIDCVFDIPDHWNYIKLSDVILVARGGSPRPIQDYLTNDEEGINWIKIGDTDLNSKYIVSCKEKIKRSGLYKTRYVHKGDFLLTNSMSFGHPYILAINGCIHDGWLVLSDKYNAYDKDYLYYLLSSPYVYKAFCSTVGGSVVKNLNSDKVSNTIVPLLPLSEQKKIANKLDYIFNYLIMN